MVEFLSARRVTESGLQDGKRVSQAVGVTTTSYVYNANGSLPVLLDDGGGKYVWGVGLAYPLDSPATDEVYDTYFPHRPLDQVSSLRKSGKATMNERAESVQGTRLRRAVITLLWWALTSVGNTIVGIHVGIIIIAIGRPLLLVLDDYNPLHRPAVQVALGVALSPDAVIAIETIPFVVAITVAGIAAGLAQAAIKSRLLMRTFRGELWWIVALTAAWGSGALLTTLFWAILLAGDLLTTPEYTLTGLDRVTARTIVNIILIGMAVLVGLIVWVTQWLILSGHVQRVRWRIFANTLSYYPTFIPVFFLGGPFLSA